MQDDLTIVSSHYSENLDWLLDAKYPVVVSTNHPTYQHKLIDEKLRSPVNRGREASAYIRYIVQYYENLPPYIAFIHGHEKAWHQKFPGTLLDAIDRAKRTEFDFISLNCKFTPWDFLRIGNPFWERVPVIYAQYFESYVGVKIPNTLQRIDTAAQFIVKREQITQYPKHIWEEWLRLTQDPSSLPIYDFEKMPWFFEYTWHIIFGEPCNYYERDEREYIIRRFQSGWALTV